ncbi:MAG: hypothetical protein ABJM12_00925, partial [Ekhidna sp.]
MLTKTEPTVLVEAQGPHRITEALQEAQADTLQVRILRDPAVGLRYPELLPTEIRPIVALEAEAVAIHLVDLREVQAVGHIEVLAAALEVLVLPIEAQEAALEVQVPQEVRAVGHLGLLAHLPLAEVTVE